MTTPIISEDAVANRDHLEEFVTRFEELAGKIYRCPSIGALTDLIETIIGKRGQNEKCYIAREAVRFIKSEGAFNLANPVPSALLYEPEEGTDGLDSLKEADIGITVADFAIAETGCAVEVSYSDSMKLLSSLSRVNIILVKSKNILGTLQELAPIARDLLSRVDKPTITLISGPSRTSDIEMKFVLGVHGPHEVHAIILE